MTSRDAWERIGFSPAAIKDLGNILLFTGSTWGPHQLQAYEEKLHKALLTIVRNPKIGKPISPEPYSRRVLCVGSHLILYRVSDSRIWVARVLHHRMNFKGRQGLR